ncbi:hypothetical protein OH76DRAFT_829234 [Lentinus brumalis]|uniref:Uncharacterized protein n=1 Tax=Lentinus brumalis TaxID=2498619 RepID=A0A371CGQ7_9APHY|nr:hypothetical protein OH76DRAFT_829234 [Polyporus brumalis]
MKGRFRIVSCSAGREREACRRSGQDAPARACAGGTRSKVRRVLPRTLSQRTAAADHTGPGLDARWVTGIWLHSAVIPATISTYSPDVGHRCTARG